MFVTLGGEHPTFFRFADESKSDEITFEHLDGLLGESHLRGDHIQSHWTFAFSEDLQVTLFHSIQSKTVDLFDLAHLHDMSRCDDVCPRC